VSRCRGITDAGLDRLRVGGAEIRPFPRLI
jgi:hypothetical protein